MPIANFFIPRLLDYFRRETEYGEDDIDMMRYSLQAILWEVEKTIYLLLLFLALGFHWHFLACLVAIMTIRPSAGGFHASTPWQCFFWTLLGFVLAFFILPLIPFLSITVVLVGIFSIIVTFTATPVRSKQIERIADTSKDKEKKYKATIITIIWFLLIFTKQDFFLTPFVMWIIFLQNIQLLIEYLRIALKIR